MYVEYLLVHICEGQKVRMLSTLCFEAGSAIYSGSLRIEDLNLSMLGLQAHVSSYATHDFVLLQRFTFNYVCLHVLVSPGVHGCDSPNVISCS